MISISIVKRKRSKNDLSWILFTISLLMIIYEWEETVRLRADGEIFLNDEFHSIISFFLLITEVENF